ncbi:hypothetical protein [Baaleninema simplex]|uniref:hypothetical protein n=1 Tax=Baaleninema simplex TaxID=2862350 RepID=UPI00034D4262|nr:hypothetical protein [Baaleninema simplex]
MKFYTDNTDRDRAIRTVSNAQPPVFSRDTRSSNENASFPPENRDLLAISLSQAVVGGRPSLLASQQYRYNRVLERYRNFDRNRSTGLSVRGNSHHHQKNVARPGRTAFFRRRTIAQEIVGCNHRSFAITPTSIATQVKL